MSFNVITGRMEPCGVEVKQCTLPSMSSAEKVLEAFAKNPMSVKDAVKKLKSLSKLTIYRAVARLVQEGKLFEIGRATSSTVGPRPKIFGTLRPSEVLPRRSLREAIAVSGADGYPG